MGHGDLENLVFNSKFPQLFEKDSGRRAWPGPSEKRRGEGESLQESLLSDSKFPGAGCGSELWARGPQGEEEAGLENLVFNSKFPRFGWERAPSRWNTRCWQPAAACSEDLCEGVRAEPLHDTTALGIETKTFA